MLGESTWCSSSTEMAADPRTRQRLERCWAMDFEFDLIPSDLKEVSLACVYMGVYMDGVLLACSLVHEYT